MRRMLALASAALVVAGPWVASAQQQPVTVGRGSAVKSTVPRLLPGTRGGVLAIIQGNALNSTNGPMPETMVRLRDARFGRVVDTQITDKSGMFGFRVADPGSYIVEMMANDQTLLAASQILNVNAGEAVSAIVKLPLRIPPFAGLMASASSPTAALVAGQAAATGIAAAVPTAPVSPVQ
jgi:hypothetical protein